MCLWGLSEVDGTCTEAENSERGFCSAIAGVAKWWHREEGGGGGEDGDATVNGRMKRTSRGPFHFVRLQGYTIRQTDVSRTA